MSGLVVGIDPSLAGAGVAVLENGMPVALNRFGRSLHEGASYEQRAKRMTDTASRVLQAVPHTAELVVIEGMSYGSQGKYTDPDVYGLWWLVVTNLVGNPSWSLPLAVVPPPTLKVWATGKAAEKVDGVMRRTSKSDMLAAAEAQFPGHPIQNGDVADALHCATLAAAKLGHPLPFRLGRRHISTIAGIHWPTLRQEVTA